jgi:hypothetical protein
MKVEEMLGKSKHEVEWSPRDNIGNTLAEGDVVIVGINSLTGYIYGRVTAVKVGGIDTPQGKSPTMVRIIVDITLPTGPGAPLKQVSKVVNPVSELMLNHLASKAKDAATS